MTMGNETICIFFIPGSIFKRYQKLLFHKFWPYRLTATHLTLHVKKCKDVELKMHQSSWAGESIKKLKRMDNRGN
ncbi:MAG: hypothetical protein DRN21_00085, partial [Thermoplasmata archaeon]